MTGDSSSPVRGLAPLRLQLLEESQPVNHLPELHTSREKLTRTCFRDELTVAGVMSRALDWRMKGMPVAPHTRGCRWARGP